MARESKETLDDVIDASDFNLSRKEGKESETKPLAHISQASWVYTLGVLSKFCLIKMKQ